MSITTGPFKAPSPLPTLNQRALPYRTLLLLVVLIFSSELLAMAILRQLDISNYLVASVVDGLIMLLFISPGLYYLQVKPLLKHLSDRQQSEQALLENEDLLRTILEMLPVGVWVTDRTGTIVHGNLASQRIWGGARYVGVEEYGEYKAWWLESGKSVEPDEWAATRAIRNGETIAEEEIEIECFDGTHKFILNSATPIYQNETIRGAIVVNQDITHRKKSEQELIHSHQLIQKAFNSIDILIAYMDRNFNFIQVNEAYAVSAGHPVEYFYGKNHFDMYPHEENQLIFQRVVDTGTPFSVLEKPFEYPEFPERGVTYWNWSLQPVMAGDGTVQGLVLSLVNVSERKRAELLLERQNQDLFNLSVSESTQRELAESLVESMLALNSSLEIEDVLKTILDQIERTIPYLSGNIFLLDGDLLMEAYRVELSGNTPQTVRATTGLKLEQFPLFQTMYSTHQPVLIEEIRDQSQEQQNPGIDIQGSFLAAPMLVSERVIGFISLTSSNPQEYNQEYSRRLMAFAAPAALAVENAHLYAAESHARRVAETLSTAAKTLNQTLDFEPAINILLDHLRSIVPSDTTSVTLLEDQSRPFFQVSRGYGSWADRENLPSVIIDGVTDSIISRLKLFRKSMSLPSLSQYSALDQDSTPSMLRQCLIVPLFSGDELLGLIELHKASSEGFSAEQAQWAEALADQAAVALRNIWLYDQVRAKNEMLKSLAHKLVQVQETERSYIARELHDEAGQILSTLKINLGRLEQDPGCPPFIQEKLESLKTITDDVLEEIHRLAKNLRPAVLDHLGLVAALEQYTKELMTDKLVINFKARGFEDKRLPSETETAIYRIVQEALTNVRRHSQASSVGVLVEWGREGKVRVFIEDNGIGLSQEAGDNDRIGLTGMRERAEMLEGSLSIESSPGKGTSIFVEVPDGNTNSDR